ncbi:hydrolase 1, exosortase A system-associated [Sphingomonas sp.]|uniref:hydrolase 1, exosortase A system-associated n=1 Tax=Sphingomonas sp. TaxID=28214 RepID=UPI002B9C5E0C|nr:hydrolase 1, exosortase A system-associated [Sphingomonas sp.]HTG38899.1 hydrolase 1, exosortase A system-associated [Sphingomonas sp.]
MRRLIAFPCGGDTLVGTLDAGEQPRGLLIVSGGNELRIGAHRGMALMAARLAERGYPVFRFDRRGIGDSTGANRGFEESGPDIAAAIAAFRQAVPSLTHIVAFGNCDAASALALHDTAGIDALVLANPWIIEPSGDTLPPAAAIRARYAQRLRDPRAWGRLLTGGVNLKKLAGGLSKLSGADGEPTPDRLAGRVAAGLLGKPVPINILTAARDNTAIAFTEALSTPAYAEVIERATVATLDTDSHSFHRGPDKAWLEARLVDALTA